MELKGKVSKIDIDMGYGFISCSKHEDVFFSDKTQFSGLSLTDLNIGDAVRVSAKETDRGFFAEAMSRDLPKKRDQTPEVTL